MELQIYLSLFSIIVVYVCIADPNVLDWITIKISYFLIVLQLNYIKLKWMFKKF